MATRIPVWTVIDLGHGRCHDWMCMLCLWVYTVLPGLCLCQHGVWSPGRGGPCGPMVVVGEVLVGVRCGDWTGCGLVVWCSIQGGAVCCVIGVAFVLVWCGVVWCGVVWCRCWWAHLSCSVAFWQTDPEMGCHHNCGCQATCSLGHHQHTPAPSQIGGQFPGFTAILCPDLLDSLCPGNN